MDIKNIKISEKDIEAIMAEAEPVSPAAFQEDACSHYLEKRHFAVAAISLLAPGSPDIAAVLGAMIAILDKACQD